MRYYMRIIDKNNKVMQLKVSDIVIAINKTRIRNLNKIVYETIDFANEHDDIFFEYSDKKTYSDYRDFIDNAILLSYYHKHFSKKRRNKQSRLKELISYLHSHPIMEQIFIGTCANLLSDIILRFIIFFIPLVLSILLPFSEPEEKNIACTVTQYTNESTMYSIDFYENSSGTVILPDGATVTYAYG